MTCPTTPLPLVALLGACSLLLMGLGACNADQDQDGWPAEEDCNDHDPESYPGAPELCDEEDNDCDGQIDEGVVPVWYPDRDLDGYGAPGQTRTGCMQPEGYALTDTDCDDTDPARNPGAYEGCDTVDNDCDGAVDEGWRWYPDTDGDGFGAPTGERRVCPAPAGYVLNRLDCDDSDPALNPGTVSTWYRDQDGDGFGSLTELSCETSADVVSVRGDCDDTDPGIHASAPDVLGDGEDSDCGGSDAAEPSVGLAASTHVSLQAALDGAPSGAVVWVGTGKVAGAGVDHERARIDTDVDPPGAADGGGCRRTGTGDGV